MRKTLARILAGVLLVGMAVPGIAGGGSCPGRPEGGCCGAKGGCVQGGCCGKCRSGCPAKQARKAQAVWGTDYAAALAAAKQGGRPVLALFTGSDWCGWCKRLDREVFSQEGFRTWAAGHVVLLKIDFPRKARQTPEERKANEELMRRYEVKGFPTIVLLDGEGKEIESTGYREGGAKSYVKHLESLLK